MRYDDSYFQFSTDLVGKFNGKSYHWRLPTDISRKDELFQAFSGSLWFPRWFASDWDALFDCLCDFSWMSDRKIILVHDALPRLPEAELRLYLSILEDAIRWWRPDDPHALEVVFPAAERERIEALMRGAPAQP